MSDFLDQNDYDLVNFILAAADAVRSQMRAKMT
jgi:hypothetical protein